MQHVIETTTCPDCGVEIRIEPIGIGFSKEEDSRCRRDKLQSICPNIGRALDSFRDLMN